MVDLAKIRKKAKKAAVDSPQGSASLQVAESPSVVSETLPVVQSVNEQVSEKLLEDSETRRLDDSPRTSKLDKFKAEAGKRRAADAARADVADETLLELLTFVIAGEHYAVDIERIVEIVTPRNVTRIPNADATVVGILSLRGTIVTLVDVRRKLRHRESAAATADTRIVVIDFNNEIVGFLVDRVLRVVKASPGEIEPHPVVHATELDQAVRGVFRVAGALTILLDLDKLLGHTWN
jgi:purine-binding chemotaxis protein CheW